MRKLIGTLFLAAATFAGAADFRVADYYQFMGNPKLTKLVKATAYLPGAGTGVFISPNHVLTTHDILENADCGKLFVQTLILTSGLKKFVKGRSVKCEQKMFSDKTTNVAVFITDRAVRDYVRIPKSDLVTVNKQVRSLGYLKDGAMGLATECKVKAARYRYNFTTDCYFAQGMKGGPTFIYNSDDEPVVIGSNMSVVYNRNPNIWTQHTTRLFDAQARFKTEFEEIFDAAGFD